MFRCVISEPFERHWAFPRCVNMSLHLGVRGGTGNGKVMDRSGSYFDATISWPRCEGLSRVGSKSLKKTRKRSGIPLVSTSLMGQADDTGCVYVALGCSAA